MLREKLSITFIFAFLPPAKMLRHPGWIPPPLDGCRCLTSNLTVG